MGSKTQESGLEEPVTSNSSRHSKFILDETVRNQILVTYKQGRQVDLANWLATEDADPSEILNWLQGNGLEILREEHPARAIVRSLPNIDPDVPQLAPEVTAVLKYRLGEAIEILACDSERRLTFPTKSWLELFNLIRRLEDRDRLGGAITKLRVALETDTGTRKTEFFAADEHRRELTQLISFHQTDECLYERWMSMVQGNSDDLLVARVLDALKGLLLIPAPFEPDLDDLEIALRCYCRELQHVSSPQKRKKFIQEFLDFVQIRTRRHLPLVNLILDGFQLVLKDFDVIFPRSPSESESLDAVKRAIESIKDLAVLSDAEADLSHIRNCTDIQKKGIEELRYLARRRYEQLSKAELRSYAFKPGPLLSPGKTYEGLEDYQAKSRTVQRERLIYTPMTAKPDINSVKMPFVKQLFPCILAWNVTTALSRRG